MNLIRRKNDLPETLDLLSDLRFDLERFFEDPWLRGGSLSPFSPLIEVREDSDQYVVHADLPGFDKKQLNISVEGSTLTLHGERKQLNEDKKKGYQYSERYYGTFSRAVRLPSGIQADKIKTSYKDGVLEVTVPKSETAKPKMIEIEGR